MRQQREHESALLETGVEGLDILVVEDNAASAEKMAEILLSWGHDVRIAADGLAALAATEVRLPDVALIDIGLPGMDGCEVARSIAKLPGEKRPLLVAITGLSDVDDRRRSAEAGIDLHLVKPVEPEHLEHLLRGFQRVIR